MVEYKTHYSKSNDNQRGVEESCTHGLFYTKIQNKYCIFTIYHDRNQMRINRIKQKRASIHKIMLLPDSHKLQLRGQLITQNKQKMPIKQPTVKAKQTKNTNRIYYLTQELLSLTVGCLANFSDIGMSAPEFESRCEPWQCVSGVYLPFHLISQKKDLPIKIFNSNFINHHIDMYGIIFTYSNNNQLQYISNLLIPHHLQKLKQIRDKNVVNKIIRLYSSTNKQIQKKKQITNQLWSSDR